MTRHVTLVVTRSLAVLVILGLVSVAALAEQCTDLPPSALKLYRMVTEDVTENTASPEEIEHLASKSGGETPHPMLAIAYAIDSQLDVIHGVVHRSFGFCDAPEAIAIRFGIVRRDVFMTPAAAAAPCVRAALLAHEVRHFGILNAAAHAFIIQQRDGLARTIDEAKRRPAPNAEAARVAFEGVLYPALRQLHEDFSARARGPLRRSGDDPQELSRLQTACGGALSEMGKAIKGRSQDRQIQRSAPPMGHVVASQEVCLRC